MSAGYVFSFEEVLRRLILQVIDIRNKKVVVVVGKRVFGGKVQNVQVYFKNIGA